MQVKVFEAQDMATGLRMIRRELGPDALILSTRTIKDGKFGITGKQILEITAAIDNQVKPPKPQKEPAMNKSGACFTYEKNTKENLSDQYFTKQNIEPEQKLATHHQIQHENGQKSGLAMQDEIDELKSLVKNLAGQVSNISEQNSHQPYSTSFLEKRYPTEITRIPDGNRAMSILHEHGVNNETCSIISQFVTEKLTLHELEQDHILFPFLRNCIADILPVSSQSDSIKSKQRRIAFVGPTGVGKTTTLAKIAAEHLSQISSSIGLITIDTYRIAAVEQLKVYGEIMHLPVDVVITPQQLIDSIQKHEDKDLILIDTAGRSPKDDLCLEELNTFLTPELEIEKHLVLSATTREAELIHTIEKFSQLKTDKTIFTKLDECTTLGVLLNTQVKNPNPLSYITNGQRVPEDLSIADSHNIAELIIPMSNGTH